MNDDKKRILIIDDNPDDIHVLMENLSDYAALAAINGRRALELAIKDPQPDLILLDVMMPDIDGYETCRRLKKNAKTQDIDVIFISAHDTTEEKLKGYEAGGSDYLIKPVQPKELLEKIKLSLDNTAQRKAPLEENKSTQQLAMTAITSMGELGLVLEFMRSCFNISNTHELAQLIIKITQNYGLECSALVHTHRAIICASSQKPIPPIEKELLISCRSKNTLLERGARFIVNYGNTSLLIKNMPADESKRGRLRDHLALLIESANIRLQSLEMEQEVASVVKDSSKALIEIEGVHQQQKETAEKITSKMVQQLIVSFHEAAFTEEQENQLVSFIKTSANHLLENMENSGKADSLLREISERLQRFTVPKECKI